MSVIADTKVVYERVANQSAAEGSIFEAQLNTKNVPDGTGVFYEVRKAVSVVSGFDDFSASTSGSVLTNNGTA